MATIKALKTKLEDGTEQVVFPKTLPEAIIDPETNETLDVILDSLNEKIDNIEPGGGGGGATYELSRTDDTITLTGSDGSSSEITDSSAYLSRENLLVYPYYNNTSTKDGVTFTDNNGIITANGTSTATFSGFMCRHRNDNKLVLPIGTYTLSGCPEGGSTSTYYVTIGRNDSSGSWIDIGNDIGEGVTFTLTEESQIGITIAIKQDVTVENLIFKPMLEVGTVAHEYQPYNLSRQKLRSDLDNINTDVNVSDKVSKSGDTMTGDLTVKANVNIPLLADNSDSAIVTVPTAGTVDIGSTEQKITDVLTNYKSFIGSIHTKDAWNNIISTRHRNGASDGVSHGMYLRSLMNRSTPDLMWAVQAAGTWQSERAILDSGNYSNYAVPKTGGTFTGDVTFNNAIIGKSEYNVLSHDYYVFHTQDGAGKAGYWKLCTINITGTYAGAPIIFHMTSRYGNGTLGVNFIGSTDISAYSVGSIKLTDNVNNCYIGKISGTSSGSVFDIYVQKEEAYGNLTVTRIDFPKYMRDLVTLTWSGAYVASMPAGITWKSSTQCIPLYENTYSSIPAATQSRVGLMSAADKTKLDGIATGANKITVDSSLSSTSTNPVQNKVVHSHMSARLQLTGGTMTGDIKFSNAKGIKDVNGRFMLMRDTSATTTFGSINGKYPTFIGNKDSSSDATYIRGYNIAIDATTFVNSNKTIGIVSDKRVKTNESLLVDEIEKYNQFFDNLQPRKYNYTRDEEGTAKSTGFFAQEVHQALLDAGLTLSDFGGINIQESFLEGQANGNDEAVWYQDFYSLAYDEFIPIIVSKIQYLEKMYNARLEEIENDYNSRLQSLEEKISKLEEAKV